MFTRIFVALALLPCIGWSAQLTWNDVVNMALKENTSLSQANQQYFAAQENVQVARRGYLPSIRASVSATRIGSRSGGGGAIVSNGVVLSSSSSSSISNNYLGALNLTQNIFNGFEDESKIDQAEWRVKDSFWSRERVKSDLSYNLKQAFANLLYAQEYLKLTDDIIERRESNYKLVSIRYDNGRENKGSVMLSEAHMEQAKLDNIAAEDALRVARSTLLAYLNREGFDDYEATGELPMANIAIKENEIVNLATETPDYNRAVTTEKIAAKEITVARSNFLPSLDLTGNVTRQDQTFFPTRDNERWSMALTLSIPIFDGFADYSATKSAIFSKYAAEESKRTTFLNLVPQIKQAQTLAKQSDIKFSVDTKFKNASATRAEISRIKYNNGLLTFEDWDIIENELITRQITYLQSKRDRVIRYANFEKVIGKGSIP